MLITLFAALLIVAGLIAAFLSLDVQVFTGEHLATLAAVLFLFVIAIGVWRVAGLLEELVDERQKPK